MSFAGHEINGIIAKLGAINPYWYPPKECLWFDYVNGTNIVQADGEITIINFTIPIASIGTIRWLGQRLCSVANFGTITWKIKINSGPDTVYGSIVGEISDLTSPLDIMIKLPKGANIQMSVQSSSATSLYIVGRLKGWYWVEYDS